MRGPFRHTALAPDRRARRRSADALLVGTTGLLVVMAFGLLNLSGGLTQSSSFRDEVESVAGQELVADAFPAGASAPTDVIVSDPARSLR